ncbi:hypothetical protein CF647_36590 [Burkholderia sp. 117]|nr:hypothetical protein CF649_22755 [Burkholderia sp. 136(2017)]PNX13804.1 hypothetical protein CF650_17690 [Burkholderia sp. 129]PNX22171.1 hypothetical protein CF647_36590 [Burkholderia sp. 117]PNX37444.1 hypothetical protein CF648_17405 [Burkholderia sp. 137]
MVVYQHTYAKVRGLSERRACALMSVARSALHDESKLAVRDAPVLAAMSILLAQHQRINLHRRASQRMISGHPKAPGIPRHKGRRA